MKYFLLVLLLISCSNPQAEKFTSTDSIPECEEILQKISDTPLQKISRTAQMGLGSASSYLLTGTVYGVEYTVKVTSGIALGTMICSPLILLEGAIDTSGNASMRCLVHVTGSVWKDVFKGDDVGKQVYAATKEWRCPNIDPLSQSFRRVASCYADHGRMKESIEQLRTLKENSLVKNCTSRDEWNAIAHDLVQAELQ